VNALVAEDEVPAQWQRFTPFNADDFDNDIALMWT
jgi:hypothetical protein